MSLGLSLFNMKPMLKDIFKPLSTALSLGLLLTLLTDCGTFRRAGSSGSSGSSASAIRTQDRAKIKSELDGERSLKATRDETVTKALEESSEDEQELKSFLDLMKQGKEQPSVVRDKFSYLVQKRRSSFRKKVERLRSDYREDEQRRREDFMNAQRSARESYFAKKNDYKANSRFTSDQEHDRQRFFGDERDRRSSFEGELSTQQKDFDSFMRERQTEFNEQFRIYSKKISEQLRPKKAVTGDEFKRFDDIPTSPLGTDD